MVKSLEICPICGDGHLEAKVEKSLVEYNGQTRQLDAHYSVCDACGSEQADTTQARTNRRAMLAFKKEVDGLLTGAELRALRERLGISQAQAAVIFGGGPVAFSKYESDDVMQSEAMDKLLRLAADVPDAFEHLAKQVGVVVKAAPARQPAGSAYHAMKTDIRPASDDRGGVRGRVQDGRGVGAVMCG